MSAAVPLLRRSLSQCAWPAAIAWALVAGLVIANVPLMLCMPLAADAVLYDLQAKTALGGGVLYRDIVEPNLPGIVWCHMAIRTLFGWSEAALKWVDLAIVAGVLWLLGRWMFRVNGGLPARMIIVAGFTFWAFGFYCSTPEWVHCQRDIWLMLPALAAFTLRNWRLFPLATGSSVGPSVATGVIEGVLWGMAFWIKPYVSVPAVFVIGMTSLLAGRRRRDIGLEVLSVVLGGAVVGLAGSLWMIATGVWPHFWEMMLGWNPVYFANGRSRWTLEQYLSLSRDLAPWCFVHLAALPVAALQIRSAVLLRWTGHAEPSVEGLPVVQRGMLAALYLGWMFQAHFLQHPFHYCHTPTVILAAAVLAGAWPVSSPRGRLANLAWAASLSIAVATAPCFDVNRLAWWPDCITRGAQPDVKCALHHRNLPNWVELQPVIDFLRQQQLRDGELTAYNVFLVHLYPEVGVMPSTRYVFLDVLMQVFHERAELIDEALKKSRQKFVVCSLLENGMRAADIAGDGRLISQDLPSAFPRGHAGEFPYCLPLVFRSGQYVVYRVDGDLGSLNTRPRPLARVR